MKPKYALDLFLKDKFLSVITAAFFAFVNVCLIPQYKTNYVGTTNGDFHFLKASLGLPLYFFIFFAFISYYFIDKIRSDGVGECLGSVKNGLFKVVSNQLIVLVTILFAACLNVAVHNAAAYVMLGDFHIEAFTHILLCIAFYLYAVPVAGVLLGAAAALCLKRFAAVTVLLLWCVLISPVYSELAAMLFTSEFGVDIFPLYDFMSPMPRGADFLPDFDMGYSLLPHRLAANAFFIFLLAAVIVIKTVGNKKAKTASASLCGVLCAACLISYMIPAYEVPTPYSPKDWAASEPLYYADFTAEDEVYEEAGFRVLLYDMTFDIGRLLTAAVTVKTDEKREKFTFTLYHGYKVRNVTDKDGNKLYFEQNGDYINVSSETGTDEFVFRYSGSSPYYFANYQGAVLSGAFAYYPKPGRLPMFYGRYYYKTLSDYDTAFTVKVNAAKRFYSNLETSSENVFYGESDGVSLYSGFFDTTVINGKEIVYPYLNKEQCTAENLQRYIDILDSTEYGDIKRIIIVPDQRLGEYMNVFLHSDGTLVTAHTVLFNNKTALDCSKYVSYKLPLLSALDTLKEDPAYFNSVTEVIHVPNYEKTGKKALYLLMYEAMKKSGGEAFVSAAKEYIADNDDKRTASEFIKDYTEGK